MQRHQFNGLRNSGFSDLGDLENYVHRRDPNSRSLQEWFSASEQPSTTTPSQSDHNINTTSNGGRVIKTSFTVRDYEPPSPKHILPVHKTPKGKGYFTSSTFRRTKCYCGDESFRTMYYCGFGIWFR